MKYVITASLLSTIGGIEAEQKQPWVVHREEGDVVAAVEAFSSRTLAREYATANGLKAPIKYDPSLYDIEDEAADDTEAATTADAKVVEEATSAAAPVETPPEAASPKAPKVEVLRTSTVALPVKRVWAIADEMRKADPSVRRKDVIARCVSEGIAYYTARTQYQAYYEQQRAEAEAAAAKAAAAA